MLDLSGAVQDRHGNSDGSGLVLPLEIRDFLLFGLKAFQNGRSAVYSGFDQIGKCLADHLVMRQDQSVDSDMIKNITQRIANEQLIIKIMNCQFISKGGSNLTAYCIDFSNYNMKRSENQNRIKIIFGE